jgi:F-type H+-transporting ATPase subunit b
MLIDWFTVGAQGVNFLILVWLLRRFLYKPVLAAIDAREKSVAAKLADATAREAKAQAEGEELRKRNEAFDREREGLLRKATDEAAAERQRLIESARQDSQLLRVKLTQALADERAELGHRLSVQTQAEVFAVARKTLSDLSGASLEDRMIEVFIARLRGLPEKQRLALARAGMESGAAIEVASSAADFHTDPGRLTLVRSAFELPPARRAKVEAAIRESLGENLAIRFETSSEFVCGVELTVNGMKLAWSIADYLSSLAQDVTALAATELAVGTASAAPPTPAPKEALHAH